MGQAGSPLVGREEELARFERALDDLDTGRAAAFHVVGEAGIGKSALLAELARRSHDRRYLVFTGRAAEFERAPFGAVVEALDPYLRALNPNRLRSLGGEERDELAALFPGLAELGEGRRRRLQEERYRTHEAVRALLELLAGQRPCVLTLDDLHWADPASLELVGHLLRRAPESAVLIALAFRSAQAPRELTAAVARAERDGACECLALAPLTRDQADELLGESLDASSREALFRETGGNPFYLEQLAKTAERGRRAAVGPGATGEGVPGAVLESIAHDLARLSKRAGLLLRGAAVAGDPFTPELAAAAAGVGERWVEALDELLAADLVRTGDSPIDFRFRHPIVRAAVYESAPPGQRLGAHARAAQTLRERGAAAPALAEHVERSALPGDGAAVELLTKAAHDVSPRAPATAAAWLAAALRLLADGAPPERRLALLGPLAAALGSSGQIEQSRARLEEMLALLPDEASSLRPRIVGFMVVIDHLLGRHGEARELLERTLSELPPDSPSRTASLQFELASDRFFVGDWEAMLSWAERAWETASVSDESGLETTGAALLALALYSAGRVEEAADRMGGARRLLDASDAESAGLRLDTFDWLGWCELSMEEYEPALRHLERGLEIGRRTGQGHLLATMSFGTVLALGMTGRLREAAERSDATVELAWVSHSDQLVSWALGMRAWVALRCGDLDTAIALGEDARRFGETVADNPFSAVNAGWFGEALVEAGEPRRGRDRVLDALGGPELARIERPFHPYFYEVLTRAELANRDPEAAAGWADRAVREGGGSPLRGRRAFALAAQAQVARARGDTAAGAGLAGEAAELAGASGHRLDAGRFRMLAGQALAQVGERERAIAELRSARAELEACGAARLREQAERELRRLGESRGRGGRRALGEFGIESLSGRELEVAALVTDRLTNREIAERLVLSEKTVERHLSRIFRKLDVSSRVELARMVEAHRDGVGDPSVKGSAR